MQQHPVPQNVTQYQFRLVGDMTLKQFLELAAGLVGAYLFYASNLIFIIKWPFAIASILVGFGLAFFPIEDRPLDQWIINFLRSIYAPTRYIWKKSQKVPNVFTFVAHPVIETVTATKTVKAPTLVDLQPKASSDVSDEERQRINVLDAMLAKSAPVATQLAPTSIATPTEKPSVTVRKLKPFSAVQNMTIFQSAPRPAPTAKPITINLEDGNLAVPTNTPTPLPKVAVQPVVLPSAPTQNVIFAKPQVTTTPKVETPTATPETIHLPASPTAPNLIVGMVVNKENKIVENAIVQIISGDGVPARAIKTNSLGQFYTSTPLSQGIYTIEAEKEGFVFPPNKLIVENKIVAPILLKAS